jgi:CBS domain-containing protein
VLTVKIRELYHRGVLTAYPDETVAAVAGRMQQEAVGSLAVIEEGRLVGIVTERDLVRAASDGADPLGTRVGAYVTHGVAVADADEEASRVVRRMLNFGVRHLPVFDGDKLLGMVSMRDLVALEAWLPGEPAQT